MKKIFIPNPIDTFSTVSILNNIANFIVLEDFYVLASPLFEDYKYGKSCIVDWDQMQTHSKYLSLVEETCYKYESTPFKYSY